MFEFEAVILLCTGVSWREDVLRFNRRESANNFVKKELDVDLVDDRQGIADQDCVTFLRHLLYA